MAKSKRPTDCKEVTCNSCKKQAHGIAGTLHRWCGGSKAERKHSKQRGVWA